MEIEKTGVKMEEELEKENESEIEFYSIHDAEDINSFRGSETFSKIKIKKDKIQILLVRNNNWNDFGAFSSFWTYYFDKVHNLKKIISDKEIIEKKAIILTMDYIFYK